MKRALPLLIALILPLAAFAGDPTDPVVPKDPGNPAPTKAGDPLGYTVIPLSEVKVISLQEMMRTGGLSINQNSPDGKTRKKKKKKRPTPPAGAVAAGILGIAAKDALSGRKGTSTLSTPIDARAPILPNSAVTRAVDTPEPGSAALCLLLLPVAVGYFRTRSKNA